MQVSDLFRFKNREIRALHLTWIAFFITFYVWFNMAPLASSILASADWLTRDDIRLFAIANVALTIPARIIVGMALDKWGPRRVFSVLMVSMAIPTFGGMAVASLTWFVVPILYCGWTEFRLRFTNTLGRSEQEQRSSS